MAPPQRAAVRYMPGGAADAQPPPIWFYTRRRPEIRLTSGKGLADLTVPLSTIIDAVVKQNKARRGGGTPGAPQRRH
jgi:hypothetical protein